MSGRDLTLAAALAPLAAMGMGAVDDAAAQPDSSYGPTGINAGGFRFFPSVDLAVQYRDNVLATEANEQSDYVYQLLPSLRLESDWNTHQLNLHAEAPVDLFNEFDEQSTTDIFVGANGRLDVDRNFNFTGSVDYGAQHEPLSYSPSTQPLAEPVKYDSAAVEVGFAKRFNQLEVSAKAGVAMVDYDDGELLAGGVLEQDDRDSTMTTYAVRAAYSVSPATSLFLSAGANTREYDLTPPDPGATIDRNSDGYQVLGGVSFEVTSLLVGEIGVGYLSQSYAAADTDPTIEDTEGLAVQSSLVWSPDELVTVSLNAERTVVDAGAAGALAYLANDFSLGVDYSIRRNLTLTAGVAHSVDGYEDVDREDRRTSFDVGASYSLNRGAALFFKVGHDRQESEGADLGREYETNRASIGIRLRR